MKVVNTRGIKEKILSYLEKQQIERYIAETITGPISSEGLQYSDEMKLEELANKFLEHASDWGEAYTYDEAMITTILMTLVKEHPPINHEEMVPVYESIVRNGRIFHGDDFSKDPYLDRIWIGGESSGNYTYSNQSFERNELFIYDSPVDMGNGIRIPKIGIFDQGYNYPFLSKGDAGICGITPYLVYTMESHIEKASGKVLNLGCGMGYFAYRAHRKEDVECVTVVEKQPEKLELFQRYVLPQFDHPEKIEVIGQDPVVFMENVPDGRYDHCFADICVNNTDLQPYFQVKKSCRKYNKTKMSFWIEDSLVDTLKNMVFLEILAAAKESMGLSGSVYDEITPEGEQVLNILQTVLEKEEITRPDHFDWYMKTENVIKLILDRM